MPLSAEEKNATMSAERTVLTQLFQAALQGDFDAMKQTVEAYSQQQHNHHVVPYTYSEILSQFRDGNQRTAIHWVCQSTRQNIVEQLASWLGPTCFLPLLQLKDKDGLTPFMLAVQLPDPTMAQERTLSILKVVVASDDVKLGLARSQDGATALHYAAGAGATSITIHALIPQGPMAISTFSVTGGTPLHWACAVSGCDYTETIVALLDCGADLNSYNETIPPPIHMAVAAMNTLHANCLLQQAEQRQVNWNPSLNYRLPGNVTIWHMLADLNMVGLLAQLLPLADATMLEIVNDEEHLTAVQLAAREGHVGCVMLLLGSTEGEAQKYISEFAKSYEAPQPVSPSARPEPSHEVSDVETRATERAATIAIMTISERDKAEAQVLKTRGNAFFADKKYAEALDAYSKAIETDPTDATFYSNRSACHIMLQQPNDALYDAVMARHLKPTWPKAAYRLAVARLELGRFEDAAVAAWEGVQLDHDNDELKSLLQKCVKKGRQQHAQQDKGSRLK